MSATPPVALKSIERLVDKVKELIAVLENTRLELSQTGEKNTHLKKEVEQLKETLSGAEDTVTEVNKLLAEREAIRDRVGQMLQQLDEISV